MNHQEGASPISSGTGNATSQPITSSRLRPSRSASSPAARFVSAFAAPKATTKARIAERRAQPEVLLADERQHAPLEPDHAADERVQPDEERELAGVRAQAEPHRPSRGGAHLAGAVGGDDPLLLGRARRHVGEQRVGERLRVGEREQRVVGALEADRGERVAGEAAAADRAAVVARIEDDVVGQLEQPAAGSRAAARAWPCASPATCRSGRPTSPISSESPLKTSHGSSVPRRRSATV